ncbi:sigma-70 family RNA polymerase sigma factor [Ferrovibrio sp.]|uniref:sigma-70 family RNA polymerase sigma factor n=1 Tax=Ferrovibrio sp. TaxID=1917215 RepID=UPI0026032232|nr:sigma-70 family RNA polymerase sigma factor [Ferrovibrio sp.]
MTDSIHGLLMETLPSLKAFSVMLTRDRNWAEDLTQETALRVLAKAEQFQPGTNFKAWAFTIMRHQHIDQARRWRREATTFGDAEAIENLMAVKAPQEDQLVLGELLQAITRLNKAQRDVLVLVVGNGLSYEEAARVCGCPIGTIRSRLARARQELERMMLGEAAIGQPSALRSERLAELRN